MAIEKDKLIGMYRTMVRHREFEDRVVKEFGAGNIPGFVHLSQGQEAILLGFDDPIPRALIARQRIQVFKPAADDRDPPGVLVTRDNREVAAESVAGTGELRRRLDPDAQVGGVDEAQFFDLGLVETTDDARKRPLLQRSR